MTDIFSRQREKVALCLITNGRVLSQDHTPTSMGDVVGRDEEKKELVDFLWNVIEKGIRSDINIVGTSGLGKTYLIKAVLSDLRKQYAEKFHASFVNCKSIWPPSKYKLHNEILAPFGLDLGKGLSDRDTAEVIKTLVSGGPVIVILDEVDTIANVKGDFLYDLIELGFSLVMVSNVFDWDEKVDTRIRSRAQSNKFVFPPYSEEEIFGVLKYIRERALKAGAISDDILRTVARHTKELFLGDIRKAKNLIFQAVTNAQDEGVGIISPKHIEQALESVDRVTLTQILSNFEKQELIALASIVSVQKDLQAHARGIDLDPTTGNVHEKFKKNVQEHGGSEVGPIMMQKYFKRLKDSGIIWNQARSHKTRGRVNYWYLSEDYTVEDYYRALEENGIEPWTEMDIDKLFR